LAPSSQLACDVLVKLFIREVFVTVDGLLVENLHLPSHPSIICLVVRTECHQRLQVAQQILWKKVDIWNVTVWRTFELRIFTLHKRFDIGVCIHPVFVHVLQLRKVVQHIEEYIVQKGVARDVMVKRWIVRHCIRYTYDIVYDMGRHCIRYVEMKTYDVVCVTYDC
jgi:hypothetical protein